MKRIAQWSLVFVMIAVAGFGATILVARGAQMALMLGDGAAPALRDDRHGRHAERGPGADVGFGCDRARSGRGYSG